MKNNITVLLVMTLLLVTINSKALARYSDGTGFNAEYLFHTTKSCIDFKKSDALQWYENNVDKTKFYLINHNNADKDIAYLKSRSLKWYENNVDKTKFYLINHNNADKDIAYLKSRALKWYERNSVL